MLVEDDQLSCYLAATFLQSLGHQVKSLSNAKKALKILKKRKFDLIFTDIHMPKMNGLKLTRKIRSKSRKILAKIPVVAMTADIMPYNIEKCFKSGVNSVIIKPVSEELFILALTHIFAPEQLRVKTDKQPIFSLEDIPNQWVKNSVSLIDEKALQIISPQNRKDEWLVFITNEITQSGSQALKNLKDGLTKKKWQEILKEAHRTKGAFSMVGLKPLSNLCEKIEVAATDQDEKALHHLLEQFKPMLSESLKELSLWANTEKNTPPL
jgi:CheY-like chemotaxis protein